MTITEFLEARISEDEAAAGKLTGVAHSGGTQVYTGKAWVPSPITLTRVLAECAAKRAIIEQRNRSDKSMSMDDWSMGWSDGNYAALYALAAVYADHPDYDPEWA